MSPAALGGSSDVVDGAGLRLDAGQQVDERLRRGEAVDQRRLDLLAQVDSALGGEETALGEAGIAQRLIEARRGRTGRRRPAGSGRSAPPRRSSRRKSPGPATRARSSSAASAIRLLEHLRSRPSACACALVRLRRVRLLRCGKSRSAARSGTRCAVIDRPPTSATLSGDEAAEHVADAPDDEADDQQAEQHRIMARPIQCCEILRIPSSMDLDVPQTAIDRPRPLCRRPSRAYLPPSTGFA